MGSRSNQQQVWCDKDFVRMLNQIKAERNLNDIPTRNYGEITKEIVRMPSFKTLVDDLLKNPKKNDINIRIDFKRL